MGNPENIASWDPATEESAFFDDQRTEIIESSDEVALTALVDALAFLRSPPTANGQGGFGSEIADEWLWGLRHWVRFESVLAELVGSDPTFAVFTDPFAISPDRLPLAQGLTSTDPRYGLPGFPATETSSTSMQPILAPVGFGSITDPDRYSEWSLHSVQTAPKA